MKDFLRRFWNMMLDPFRKFNRDQVTAGLIGLIGGPVGPVAKWLSVDLHLESHTVEMVLSFLNFATPLLVVPFVMSMLSDKSKVESISNLSPVEQKDALNKVSDAAKIKIVDALPDVETVVVSNDATGKVAALAQSDEHRNIVTADQNEIDVKLGGKS